MKNRRKTLQLAGAALAALLLLATAQEAQAGCGCDHPPPDWAQITPPFASPGTKIRIHADAAQFTVGSSYEVEFSGGEATVVAQETGAIEVVVPNGINLGEQELQVRGPGMDHTYPASLFTGLPKAFKIPANPGAFSGEVVKGAVSEDGTLLLPLDVSDVLDPTQFALQLADLRLAFSAGDVVFYNADGVNLTLFTLAVRDESERQWGSYYGWNVEGDTGLRGDVYEEKVEESDEIEDRSDFLTYWRHEFHTYEAAHSAGGTHAVDANGRHPDGTLHIDHGRLVLAISGGLVRDEDDPSDMSLAEPLEGGEEKFDLFVLTAASDNPIEPAAIRSDFATSDFDELWGD